jgi:hypothetical protein
MIVVTCTGTVPPSIVALSAFTLSVETKQHNVTAREISGARAVQPIGEMRGLFRVDAAR